MEEAWKKQVRGVGSEGHTCWERGYLGRLEQLDHPSWYPALECFSHPCGLWASSPYRAFQAVCSESLGLGQHQGVTNAEQEGMGALWMSPSRNSALLLRSSCLQDLNSATHHPLSLRLTAHQPPGAGEALVSPPGQSGALPDPSQYPYPHPRPGDLGLFREAEDLAGPQANRTGSPETASWGCPVSSWVLPLTLMYCLPVGFVICWLRPST